MKTLKLFNAVLGSPVEKIGRKPFVSHEHGIVIEPKSRYYENGILAYNEVAATATKALYQQWNKPLSFNRIIKKLGGKTTKKREKADFDLSLDVLEKDSFVNIFN